SQEDTLYFLDRGKASLVRYTESGTYLDETPTSGSLRGFSSQSDRFPGGTFLTSSRFATEASFGLPFHLFDSTGNHLRSWGADDRQSSRETGVPAVRVIAKASDSTFWSAEPSRSALQLWTLDGVLVRQVRMDRDWFTEGLPVLGTVDRAKPPARIAMLS